MARALRAGIFVIVLWFPVRAEPAYSSAMCLKALADLGVLEAVNREVSRRLLGSLGDSRFKISIFDLDNNILELDHVSRVNLYPKSGSGEILRIGIRDYVLQKKMIGSSGPYADYRIMIPDSFADQEDFPNSHAIQDQVRAAFEGTEDWRGPAWSSFERRLSEPNTLVGWLTSRGHSQDNLYAAAQILVEAGVIQRAPEDFLVLGVSHPRFSALTVGEIAKWSPHQKKEFILVAYFYALTHLAQRFPHTNFILEYYDDDLEQLTKLESKLNQIGAHPRVWVNLICLHPDHPMSHWHR